MATARIPVDLFNPGQVFACLGLLEVADALIGDAFACFDWRNESDVIFVLRTPGKIDPIGLILKFVAEAQVIALAPKDSDCKDQWGTETVIDAAGVFPVSPTSLENGKRIEIKESALPIRLKSPSHETAISVSHWADVENGRQRLKTWGGAGGKSGASRMEDLLDAIRPVIEVDVLAASSDPFRIESPVGGFRLDFHRDYIPIDIGFTLNSHQATMDAMGHPFVEIMAVMGLENARPMVMDRLTYRYSVWNSMLDPALARPALGCSAPASEIRTFIANLGEPNKYDRSIRNVTEEPAK